LGPQIIENVENELKAAGASSVQVAIVWTPAWTPDAMTDDLKRVLGILPSAQEEEADREVEPPAPPVKKKRGLLGWLFR
jgi:metal-sulfur cluster biosynthetic enzyme